MEQDRVRRLDRVPPRRCPLGRRAGPERLGEQSLADSTIEEAAAVLERLV
jgi:hypothetical protein